MDKQVHVDVEYEAPEFILLNFSAQSFFVNLDEYEKVYITLKAREDAIPGNYTAKVIAIFKEFKGNIPIKVIGSAAQAANVTVVSEQKGSSMEVAPRVEINEKVCFGKPVIKGTRVPIELVLGKLAGGMSFYENVQLDSSD